MWNYVLKEQHDRGHWGRDKTIELLDRNFHIPDIRNKVDKLIKEYDDCQRYKNRRHKRYGLLDPLEIPYKPWISISMDFIVKLPKTKQGNEHI